MIKQCVILDGKIINVGEWDNGGLDKDGKPINPMPSGTTILEKDMEFDVDRGWHEVGSITEPTEAERLAELENVIAEMIKAGA